MIGGDAVWVGIAVLGLGCGGFGGCCVGCGGPPVMVSSFLCCVDAVGERRRSDLRAVFDGGMVVYQGDVFRSDSVLCDGGGYVFV